MHKLLSTLSITLLFFIPNSWANVIEKSPNDLRAYSTFTLENQLQVLLISDPDTDKAAVSMDVDVGSASNPANRPGLAHFLEHMLFLGTKKYPVASEYQDYIQSHGGSHNAFTSETNTNYFFDIKEDALEPALDRFAQFFISPLFSEKYTDRERHAVHSEYQSKLQDDSRRNFAAFKQIMNPEHPGSRFFVGSLETLSDNEQGKIRDDLLSFYQKYYSANRMTLVVLGKSSLDDLKKMVVSKFSPIINTNVPKPTVTVKRVKKSDLPLKLNVKTLKDFRLLTLSFATPATKGLWKTKPLYLLSSLVGYEGEGSLLALLKKEGLANGLSASASTDSEIESGFQVSISLTEKGLNNTDKVTELFFDFIEQLKQTGIQKGIFEEEKRLLEQSFKFLARQSPSHYVVWLSQSMREYPVQYWLSAPYKLENYDNQLITQFIAAITPDNLLMNIQAQEVNVGKNEPYFQAEYSVEKFTAAQLNQWKKPTHDKRLFVRKQNPFIAENISLVDQAPKSETTPTKYPLSEGVTLWHMQDSEFLTPKSDLFFTLLMPNSDLTVQDRVTLSLYTQLLNDKFNKVFYDASSAGISINLYPHRRGLSIRISGFNDKQHLIIESLQELQNEQFTQERFDTLKLNYKRSLENNFKEKPYNQLLGELYKIISFQPSTSDKLQALQKVSLEGVYEFASQYYKEGEIRILSHGNVTEEYSVELANKIISQLKLINPQPVALSATVLKLQKNDQLKISKTIDHNDSAVVLYLQAQGESYKQQAATALLTELAASDYYSQLRTEQQLGYIVFAAPMPVRQYPGIVFVVQSPNAGPDKIEASNQKFFSLFTDKLANLTAEDLAKYKESLIARFDTKERTINQRSVKFWQEIGFENHRFDSKEQLITATNELTVSDLESVWQSLLSRSIELSSYGKNTPFNTLEVSEKNKQSKTQLQKLEEAQQPNN